MRIGISIVLAVLALAACKSPSRLTAGAVPCGSGEVDIVRSRYTEEGVDSAWCARCKGRMYHCVSNADKSKVRCAESTPRDPCGY